MIQKKHRDFEKNNEQSSYDQFDLNDTGYKRQPLKPQEA
jgi:hypothetical protein